MNYLTPTLAIAALALAAIVAAAFWYTRKERFVPGYNLENEIKGYSAVLGDVRTMAQQNFGIDDSIQGVFSARIQTPKDDSYIRLVVPSDDNPYRANNMKLAASARCNLVCSGDDAIYMKAI